MTLRVAVALCAFCAAGCDIAPVRTADGPTFVGSDPADGATDVDRAVVLRVDLDERVAPSSTWSVTLTSGSIWAPVLVEIDVVRPGLLIMPRAPLDPDLEYDLEISSLRDLDGDETTDLPLVSFRTGRALDESPPEEPASFDEVSAIFAARCATSACHGGGAVLGLDLGSADGVRTTAIAVASTEVRRPIRGTYSAIAPAMSGLAIVEPGSPARSYLVYKVLGDPHIVGSLMPPPDGEGGEGALTPAEIDTLVSWIRGGAHVPGPS